MKKFFYILYFFFLTSNTLFPFPIDKAMMLFGIAYYLFLKNKTVPTINIKYFSLATIVLIIAIVGGAINQEFDGMLYYPIVGILFISFFKKNQWIEDGLYYGLLLHIILGLFLYFVSYIELNPFVRNMAEKGAPFLHASLGFTPTNQTFGTYCVLWLIVYFYKKEHTNSFVGVHRIYYILVLLAILTTLNRSTFLFTLLVIFFKDIRLFTGVIGFSAAIFIILFKDISTFLLNSATIDARGDLLEGFNISFWGSESYIVYLFGRGAVFISDKIAQSTTWSFRKDIENGYAFLLHGYGFIGLTIYLVTSAVLIVRLTLKSRLFDATTLFFYMFLSLYFTQELVSNSFYLFIAFIFYKSEGRRTL